MSLIQQIQYQKKLGQYRPHFQGKPEGYYELSCTDVVCAFSFCTFIVAAMLFVAYGFFLWTDRLDTSNFVLVWSIITCIIIPLFIIFAFIGSRNKVQIESRLIKEALERENKNKNTGKNKKESKLQHEHYQTIAELNEDRA